jgi:hypothetical protein
MNRPFVRAKGWPARAAGIAVLVMALWTVLVNPGWAQFRVPIPRVPVVPRPVPVPHHIPVHPHVPLHGGNRGDDAKSDGFSAGEWAAVAGLVGGGAALAGYAFYPAWRRRRRRTLQVRIIATPPGEAPEAVRRAWIGLQLPLAPGESNTPRVLPLAGVLSGQEGEPVVGYVVEGKAAVAALEFHDSAAARWWRENVPGATYRGYRLGFPAEVCELVGGG